MLFHFNERLVDITSLKKSFTTTPAGEVKPCIIIHLSDWEDGRAYTTQVTMRMKYWEFFLAIINLEEIPIQLNTLLIKVYFQKSLCNRFC